MKNFKKLISVALTLVFCFSLVTGVASAADDDTVAILRYTENGVTQEMPFTSVDTALARARTGQTVYVVKPASLGNNAEVKSGVTLVIPTSNDLVDADELKEGNGNAPGGITTPTVFATLTVPEKVTLTVNGTLIVAGNQQSTQPLSGFLSGPYGAMVLDGELVVNGEFYARGEVTTNGTGSITANSGGSVYQRFQIYDWRGGTQSVAAHLNEVFPFSIYDLGGISVDTTYLNGSNLIGQSYLYISDTPLTENVNYLGSANGLVRFKEETGNGVTFTKDSNGVTTITANTDLYTDGLGLTVTVGEIFGRPITHTFSTKTRDCPFGFKLNLTVAKDASLSVESRFKILPGCTFDIEGSLDVTSDGALYFYAAGTYSTNYFFNNAGSLAKMNWDISKAATLEGTGTFTSTGKIGSSVADWTNLPSTFEKTNQTAIVREFEQGEYTYTPVTFHLATPPATPAE